MSTAVAFDLAQLLLVDAGAFEHLQDGDVYRSGGALFTAPHEEMFARLAMTTPSPGLHVDAAEGIKSFALSPAGSAQLAAYIGDNFIGFSGARAEVLGPIRAGDILYSQLLVSQLCVLGRRRLVTIEALIHTQDGALALFTEHTYLASRARF